MVRPKSKSNSDDKRRCRWLLIRITSAQMRSTRYSALLVGLGVRPSVRHRMRPRSADPDPLECALTDPPGSSLHVRAHPFTLQLARRRRRPGVWRRMVRSRVRGRLRRESQSVAQRRRGTGAFEHHDRCKPARSVVSCVVRDATPSAWHAAVTGHPCW